MLENMLIFNRSVILFCFKCDRIQGSVDSLVINGLSGFIVNRWFVDAAKSKIEFDLSLANLFSTGRYNIDGVLIHFFPLRGSGNYKSVFKTSKNLITNTKSIVFLL